MAPTYRRGAWRWPSSGESSPFAASLSPFLHRIFTFYGPGFVKLWRPFNRLRLFETLHILSEFIAGQLQKYRIQQPLGPCLFQRLFQLAHTHFVPLNRILSVLRFHAYHL